MEENMQDKKISVITPVFNRQDCIGSCLESVSLQSVPKNWELEHIVVDDGSSDNTLKIIEKYAEEHNNVKIHSFTKNQGTNAARNKAIREASGKWIVFLDSDDILLPDSVTVFCRAIEENPDYKHFLFPTDDMFAQRKKYGEKHIFHFDDFLLNRETGDFTHLFLRSIALAFPFNESLRIYEGIFFLRYYKEAEKILYVSTIITSRNRKRKDRVTYMLNMDNDSSLLRKLKAQRLQCELYESDYLKTDEGRKIYTDLLTSNYLLSLLAGYYQEARQLREILDNHHSSIPFAYRAIESLHCGQMTWNIIKRLIKLKHRIKD